MKKFGFGLSTFILFMMAVHITIVGCAPSTSTSSSESYKKTLLEAQDKNTRIYYQDVPWIGFLEPISKQHLINSEGYVIGTIYKMRDKETGAILYMSNDEQLNISVSKP